MVGIEGCFRNAGLGRMAAEAAGWVKLFEVAGWVRLLKEKELYLLD